MSRPVKIVSRSIIFMSSVVVFLYSGSYSRVLDPPMSIRINGQIMPLTGGLALNRNFLIGMGMVYWIVLLMTEMADYNIGRGW